MQWRWMEAVSHSIIDVHCSYLQYTIPVFDLFIWPNPLNYMFMGFISDTFTGLKKRRPLLAQSWWISTNWFRLFTTCFSPHSRLDLLPSASSSKLFTDAPWMRHQSSSSFRAWITPFRVKKTHSLIHNSALSLFLSLVFFFFCPNSFHETQTYSCGAKQSLSLLCGLMGKIVMSGDWIVSLPLIIGTYCHYSRNLPSS